MTENRYAEYFDEIYDEVSAILEEEDAETRVRMVDEILCEHPENPFAQYLKWQELDEDESEENRRLLLDAVETLRPAVAEAAESGEIDEEILSAYVSMLSDLASLQYFSEEKDAALETAREFMKLDRDCYIIGRLVYYTLLVEKKAYAEVVSAADDDVCETPIAAHCRAIALFETEGASAEASDALLEAISMDPDMSFYILGLWELDDEAESMNPEEDAYMEDLVMHVSMLSELWNATEERLAFLGVVVFAFGYMTGRMDDTNDTDMLEDGYKTLGCLDEMQEARDTLHAMIASGKEQEAVDEEALMLFRDIRDQGFFS
ncbi:hypothetical protein LJC31_01020 [Synergistaceae bacterium OttesenSCG-928-I11]|nr:hypothetical protein [Synergistaceae bacterium OttesenSCG-928-I11]